MKRYEIATANSRHSKYWKNIKISFDELIERLKNPTITSETLGEFRNMTRSEQEQLKDVGGIVCGYLKDGKRSSNSLEYRSILTLDADFANEGFCELIGMCADYSYIIHSTRKHTEEKPRFRLIIPLNRNCSTDEYEAVARHIANEIGIDMFDDTTYQANRLMYYPSLSNNQRYVLESNTNGVEIDVDKVLSQYSNWKDRSTWYVSSRVDKVIAKELRKQKNPLEKDGYIGAFCRTYDIESVIEKYLCNVYEKCDIGERYTYLNGSTSGGAVPYENGAFLYSNHSTDPICGKLCNAFDLVRIHKFGELDEDMKDGTPSSKTPSYLAMLELINNDKDVKILLQTERINDAKSDFEDLELDTQGEQEIDFNWLSNLKTNKNGKNLSTIDNVYLILNNDANLKGKLAYNEFTGRPVIRGKVPWNKEKNKIWGDEDDAGFSHYVERFYDISGKDKIQNAWTVTIYENTFHPVRDYIKEIDWDGVERLESLFIDYLGAEDNRYTRAVTKCTLVGGVRRIFEPGCKFDTALILVGGQGKGKTEIVKRLGVDWFSDSLTTFRGKEAYEQIQGKWILELGELEALRKAEVSAVKHFMTKTEDSFRGAYARHIKDNKRQCIFIGTSNTHDFLRDATGDRRFYPIDINKIDTKKDIFKDLTKNEVGQIWAEAYVQYKKGEKSYIDDKNILEMAEEEQKGHREESPFQGIVQKYLDTLLPSDWKERDINSRRKYLRDLDTDDIAEVGTIKRTKVCVQEIWCEALDGHKKDLNRQISNEIKNCIVKTGDWEWSKKTLHFEGEYGKQKGFSR